MATQDPGKDHLEQSDATENVESQELAEKDLKAVTGGLSGSFGGGLSGPDASVCVSD